MLVYTFLGNLLFNNYQTKVTHLGTFFVHHPVQGYLVKIYVAEVHFVTYKYMFFNFFLIFLQGYKLVVCVTVCNYVYHLANGSFNKI